MWCNIVSVKPFFEKISWVIFYTYMLHDSKVAMTREFEKKDIHRVTTSDCIYCVSD